MVEIDLKILHFDKSDYYYYYYFYNTRGSNWALSCMGTSHGTKKEKCASETVVSRVCVCVWYKNND